MDGKVGTAAGKCELLPLPRARGAVLFLVASRARCCACRPAHSCWSRRRCGANAAARSSVHARLCSKTSVGLLPPVSQLCRNQQQVQVVATARRRQHARMPAPGRRRQCGAAAAALSSQSRKLDIVVMPCKPSRAAEATAGSASHPLGLSRPLTL